MRKCVMKSRRYLTTTLLTLFAISAPALSMNASDVSVLLPLPNGEEISRLLSPQTQGSHGPLIPESILQKLPALVASQSNELTFALDLKVLAFRIDPCFQEGDLLSVSCRHQIRLIWQPLKMENGIVKTKDAAIHTFYDFNDADWKTFLDSYEALVSANPSVPGAIQINRTLVSGGYNQKYWRALSALLINHCGQRSLSRITLMSLDFNENQWVFRGFDVLNAGLENQTLKKIVIPKIHATGQVVSMLGLNIEKFDASISPFSQSDVGLWLYDNSETVSQRFTQSEIQNFMQDELTLENPTAHNPGTTDCVACHLAMATIDWAQLKYPNWDWNSIVGQDTSRQPILAPTEKIKSTSRLRAFGYVDREPVISPRVANETRRVLVILNEAKPVEHKIQRVR